MAQHKRLPLSSLFFADSELKKALNLKTDPYSQFGRCFEVCQWAPSSFNAQPTRCSAVLEDNEEQMKNDDLSISGNASQLIRFDFYSSTISRYYAPVALGIWCTNWEIGCKSLGIKGRLEVITENVSGISTSNKSSDLPIYDVSWVLDETVLVQ